METAFGVIGAIVMIGVPVFLFGAMIVNIRGTRRRSQDLRRIWKNFGLSVVLAGLFLLAWSGQAAVQWNAYAAEQRTHGEEPVLSGYLAEFGESTLENWQSEFLQLFSFVVLAAMFIHHGSAESRDSDDRVERLLERIAEKVGAER